MINRGIIFFYAAMLFLCLVMVGCVGGNQTVTAQLPALPADEQVKDLGPSSMAPVEMTRWGAWAYGKGQEQASIRAAIAVEGAKYEARIVEAESKQLENKNITIIADTPAKITALNLLKSTEALSNAMDLLGKVALEHARSQEKGLLGFEFKATPMPKGAFAEGVDAVGTAGGKLLSAPATVVTAASYGAVAGARAAFSDKPTTSIEAGENVKIDFNDVGNDKSVVTPGAGTIVQQEIGTNRSASAEGEGSTAEGAEALQVQEPNTVISDDSQESVNVL